MRLTAKFLAAFVVTSFLVLAASGYFRVKREIELFEADMRQDAATHATALAHAVSALAKRSDGVAEAEELIKRTGNASKLGIRWVTLNRGAGSLPSPQASAMVLAPLARGKIVFLVVPPAPGTPGALLAYAPVEASSRATARSAIEVSESLEPRNQFVLGSVRRTGITMAMAFAATALVALVLGFLFVARPLEVVSRKVRRIGAGDLGSPLLLKQYDEVGDIARELNAMCDRLAAARRKAESETSARIAALEQLRHADRLASVGRLAAGIAHEVGTPLAVIAGRSTMIATGEVTGPEIADNARIVVDQTKRISTIIHQLLDFSRKRPAQRARVDLTPLGRKTMALLEPLAVKGRVKLVFDEESAQPMFSEVDPGQIEQALTNLVINAIQATPPGGKVELGLCRAHIKPDPEPSTNGAVQATFVPGVPRALDQVPREGEYVALTVADTGAGMDPDTVAHVFEPFYTTKDVGEGTGLGLPVALGFVREHRGFIDVVSERGRGSRFTMYLPSSAEKAA